MRYVVGPITPWVIRRTRMKLSTWYYVIRIPRWNPGEREMPHRRDMHAAYNARRRRRTR